jgi:hypothetical protein
LTTRWLFSPNRELFQSSFCKRIRFAPEDYGVGEEVVAVDSAAGDSVIAELVVVVSGAAVALGLADGVTVSVFCSQAASRPALSRMQMYFFMAGF